MHRLVQLHLPAVKVACLLHRIVYVFGVPYAALRNEKLLLNRGIFAHRHVQNVLSRGAHLVLMSWFENLTSVESRLGTFVVQTVIVGLTLRKDIAVGGDLVGPLATGLLFRVGVLGVRLLFYQVLVDSGLRLRSLDS